MKNVTPFGKRLIEAFGGASKAEIARRLGYSSQSPITKYTTGEKPPGGEFLLEVARTAKNCDLHYLLTGVRLPRAAGSTGENPYDLTPEQLLFIKMLAENRDVDFNVVMREVVFDGLDARAQALSLTYRTMGSDQLEDVLNAVLAARREEVDGAEDESTSRSPRHNARLGR